MKKLLLITGCILMCLCINPSDADAQLFKGFGKKLEKKLEDRLERKADRHVDKVIDKADKKTDEPIDDAIHNPKSKKKDTKETKSSAQKETATARSSSKNKLTFEEVVAQPDRAMNLMGSNCTDFIWFKKGALVEYEVSAGESGKEEATYRTEILDLSPRGSATVARVRAGMIDVTGNAMEFEMNYICDGDKMYMDVSALSKAVMDQMAEKDAATRDAIEKIEMDFEESYVAFPKNMYPGMKLEDVDYSFRANTGAGSMAFYTTVSDRQVVARENVTTPAGTFDCLKIRSVSNTKLEVMGFRQEQPAQMEYVWIAPTIGVIKQEIYNGKKVESTMVLKKFKM